MRIPPLRNWVDLLPQEADGDERLFLFCWFALNTLAVLLLSWRAFVIFRN
jgi:hypothetical protein